MKPWQLVLDDDEVTLIVDALYLAIRLIGEQAARERSAETKAAYHAQAVRLEAFREERVLPLLDTVERVAQARQP